MSSPPVEWLLANYTYDPDTGVIYYAKAGPRRKVGAIAGGLCKEGYAKICMTYEGRLLSRLSHRVAWAMHHGEWPPADAEVDHINRVRRDNRACNLRIADDGLNARNAPGSKKLETDATGYSPVMVSGKLKYQAQIKKNGRSYYLGLYASAAEALAAYKGAKRVLP